MENDANPFHRLRRVNSITSLMQMRRRHVDRPTILSILMSSSPIPWRRVEERLATHPLESLQCDSEGWSTLRRALSQPTEIYPPFTIVRAILRANPRAAWDEYITEQNNPSSGVEQTITQTNISIACMRRASLETLELLTKARPAIPQDASALSTLWESYTSLYGDNEDFFTAALSSNHHRDAGIFLIGCKFQLILKYLSENRLLLTSIRQQSTLLHVAASSESYSVGLLQCMTDFLYRQSSATLSLNPDQSGNYPIHGAINTVQSQLDSNRPSREVLTRQVRKIRYLMHEFPYALKHRNNNGRLPFHLAVQAGIVTTFASTEEMEENENNEDESLFPKIRLEHWIAGDPDALVERDHVTGLYPFQLAALDSSWINPRKAPSNCVISIIYDLLRPVPQVVQSSTERVVQGNKEACLESTRNESEIWIDDFPYNNSHETMNTIITQGFIHALDDDCLKQFCTLWTHPLLRCSSDRATASFSSWNVISAASQIWSCPLGLLRALIQLHPEKLLEKDESPLGWLPIHYAVAAAIALSELGDASSRSWIQRSRTILDKIRLLLDACPNAAQIPDSQNRLPFHLAVLCGKGVDLCKLLLRYYPQAIRTKSSACYKSRSIPSQGQHRQRVEREDWFPFQLAAQSPHCTLDDVFYLLSESPDLMRPNWVA